MEKTKISIIEDNKIIRENVSKFIAFHEEFELTMSQGSVEPFLHEINTNPNRKTDILLLDMGDFKWKSLSKLYNIPAELSLLHNNNFITFDFVGININTP